MSQAAEEFSIELQRKSVRKKVDLSQNNTVGIISENQNEDLPDPVLLRRHFWDTDLQQEFALMLRLSARGHTDASLQIFIAYITVRPRDILQRGSRSTIYIQWSSWR